MPTRSPSAFRYQDVSDGRRLAGAVLLSVLLHVLVLLVHIGNLTAGLLSLGLFNPDTEPGQQVVSVWIGETPPSGAEDASPPLRMSSSLDRPSTPDSAPSVEAPTPAPLQGRLDLTLSTPAEPGPWHATVHLQADSAVAPPSAAPTAPVRSVDALVPTPQATAAVRVPTKRAHAVITQLEPTTPSFAMPAATEADSAEGVANASDAASAPVPPVVQQPEASPPAPMPLPSAAVDRAAEQAARAAEAASRAAEAAAQQAAAEKELAARQLAQQAADAQRAAQLAAERVAEQKLAEQQAAQRAASEAAARQLESERVAQEQAARAQQAADEQQAKQLALERAAAQKLALEQAAQKVLAEQTAQKLAAEQAAQKLAAEQAAQKLAADQAARKAAQAEAERASAEAAHLAAAQSDARDRGQGGAAASLASAGTGARGDTQGGGFVARALEQARTLERAHALTGDADNSRLPGAGIGLPPLALRRLQPGVSDQDVSVRLYIESWRAKTERNGNLNYSATVGSRPHDNPVVSVAIRSDGSLENVTIVKSSGIPELDAAVRRIAVVLAPYSKFPPDLARRYDVIEIRRVWTFEGTLAITEDIR